MDALNHADQLRLANLITNDNSDDAEIQKKIDQVVELISSTRDQAAVALHDCHYDVEKAVDMILEGDHSNESQWKSAGKKKNKNLSQANHTAQQHHNNKKSTRIPDSVAELPNKDQSSLNVQSREMDHGTGGNSAANAKGTFQDVLESNRLGRHQTIPNSQDNKASRHSAQLQHQNQHHHQQHHLASKQQQQQQSSSQHNKKSTRIPESAVEMPNNELHMPSLNVQFGEMDIGTGGNSATAAASAAAAADTKGTFQDVLESNRLSRHQTIPNSQDNKTSRHSAQLQQQQHLANKQQHQQQQQQQQQQGRQPRRPYNTNSNNSNNNDDRRFYNNNSTRGRQISGNQRPYNPRPGQMNNNNTNSNNNNSRGVRTILNRGLQPNSNLPSNNSTQTSGGFPNSIDTWTNSTAEQASKPANTDQAIGGVAGTMRVGQWSEIAGNEDWSEEDWEAKVMETKVFTPSTKPVDVTVPGQKNQPLLTDKSVPGQMNLASKLSESVRDDVSSQQNTLNAVSQQGHSQHSSQKPITHMNDIFDASVAKAVLEQQNLAAIKPKTSISMSQYTKESSDSKTLLDQQNLNSIKPKTTMSMNQYNKEASESLKSLVGISSSAKSGVPSVPPGALPLMSQPQYIMGNAYHQPAMIPYYQAPDVHYQVAAQTAGREQNFQSVYSQGDAIKFNRGTDGDAPSITTTQAAPVASQTHNQAFVANALHGYQLTYAMPGAFNMPHLYGAPPIFPHIPQPTNTGSANSVYQKNSAASYQHHTGYSGYDQTSLNPLIQDYVKQQQSYSGSNMQQQQQQQQQQPTSKASGVSSELDNVTGANSYGMYGSGNKGQTQQSKQATYTDSKSYQQQMSNNGPQQQFGFSHSAQQPSSISGYPLLQAHNLDNSSMNSQSSAQQQLQHSSAQRGGSQVNSSKYYPSWN